MNDGEKRKNETVEGEKMNNGTRNRNTHSATTVVGYDAIAKALVAGGVAGGVSRTVVAPLERIKILLQVQGATAEYKGVWSSLSHMARNEGIRGLLKGNGANCLRIIPNSAVKFFAYERGSLYLLEYLRENHNVNELNSLHRLAAGAGAGIIAMSATYPLEMVRGRLTILNEAMGSKSPYKGILHAAISIVRAEGLLALYKGWLPSVIGVIPYVGLNFAVYESLKKQLVTEYKLKDERQLSIQVRLGCGALAGSVGQTIAYPLDVVRRRLQVSGWEAGKMAMATLSSGSGNVSGSNVVKYSGMVDCLKKVVAEEGVAALFRGLWPNYLKVVPSISIAFVVYEQMKEFLGVQMKISD